ncbi:MAG: chemotaxis protein CheW [Deltaproteobacteria bacterium]|nr:chemotaxis protein CheW [Deltaproteobacteria bacterium]
MEYVPYLIFKLHGSLYAVKAVAVREILGLPELTPIEEAPACIAGVFNLRGRVVPVMDLDMRFGHTPCRYLTTDSVIVLETEDMLAGIVGNEVLRVETIASGDIEAIPDYVREGRPGPHFLDGEAKAGGDCIMLLNLHNLIKHEDLAKARTEREERPALTGHPAFCPGATDKERRVFRERANGLSRPAGEKDVSGLTPLAVISLNNEYFGVELGAVREFSGIRDLTPVPCCGRHVLGYMNLRGNLVTLLDIRGLLNLPANDAPAKAIIAGAPFTVGVAIDDIADVLYIAREDITPAPMAVEAPGERYALGTAPYNGRAITVIDLPKVLSREELIVNEEA